MQSASPTAGLEWEDCHVPGLVFFKVNINLRYARKTFSVIPLCPCKWRELFYLNVSRTYITMCSIKAPEKRNVTD